MSTLFLQNVTRLIFYNAPTNMVTLDQNHVASYCWPKPQITLPNIKYIDKGSATLYSKLTFLTLINTYFTPINPTYTL